MKNCTSLYIKNIYWKAIFDGRTIFCHSQLRSVTEARYFRWTNFSGSILIFMFLWLIFAFLNIGTYMSYDYQIKGCEHQIVWVVWKFKRNFRMILAPFCIIIIKLAEETQMSIWTFKSFIFQHFFISALSNSGIANYKVKTL